MHYREFFCENICFSDLYFFNTQECVKLINWNTLGTIKVQTNLVQKSTCSPYTQLQFVIHICTFANE